MSSSNEERRLRVIVLCLEWPRIGRHTGGVGRYAARLVDALSRVCEVEVVAYDDADMNLAPRAALWGVPPPRSRFARYYTDPVRAARVVRRRHADVVHSHGDDWALLLARRRLRIVRTFYGSGLGEALGGGSVVRRLNHVVLFGLELLSRARIRTRVAIGPDSLRTFSCQHVIPPVVPSPTTQPASAESFPRERAVAFIGAFDGRKRGWLAQETWRQVQETEPDVALRVVGAPDDRENFDADVHFSAGPTDEEVQALLARSMVLIVPSTYEGFGIPMWEALCQGTPVVATGNPGSAWQARHARGGVFLAEDDELAGKVCDLLKSPAAWAAASTRARDGGRRISDLADPSRYLEIYRRVVNGVG